MKKLKQNQKGIAPIIVLVILSLLALGGTATYVKYSNTAKKNLDFSASQRLATEIPSGFAGWQEHNNEKYHYKIKYPGDWYFVKEGYSPPPPTAIKLSSISDPYPSASVEHLSVGIDVDKALGRTLDNYEEIISLKSQYYQETRLTIGGEPAAKIAVPDPNSTEPVSVYIQHKDYIYRIVWDDNTDQFIQNRKLLEKILQSFIFTD